METSVQVQGIRQLTARQRTTLGKVQMAGKSNEITFARKTIEFKKIKEFDLTIQEEKLILSESFMMLFIRISNLSGIKGKLDDINNSDIVSMMMLKYKNLSFEEIDYAFKLERYGVYEERTEHFQLFNAEYVSSVLDNYKKWLRTTRTNYNLPITKPVEVEEISESDKEIIVINGVIDCFELYKSTKIIEPGKSYVYKYLFEKGFLPAHNKSFREKCRRKALKAIYREKQNTFTGREIVKKLRKIQNGEDLLKTKCMHLVMETFFNYLIVKEKSIQEVIRSKK